MTLILFLENTVAAQKKLSVGDRAPGFTLLSGSGEQVSLSDFLGREVILFFYPMDNTPGCTAEACSFRDSYEDFRDAGAEVVGISSNSVGSHKRFADRFNLPFRLLSDSDGSVRELYGIARTMGLIPGRVTYVIDREGVIRHLFSSQFQPARHVAEALKVLNSLRAEAKDDRERP